MNRLDIPTAIRRGLAENAFIGKRCWAYLFIDYLCRTTVGEVFWR